MFKNLFRGIRRPQAVGQPVTKKVVSRTEPETGQKRAVYAIEQPRNKPTLKSESYWQGREIQ